ncbi:serine protease inhibitor 42Dd-like isoform X3 [Bactrocera tryoni]|uniref:serine protease inhibitor 42Dd-like isoform X3 n=1 Tax=Bactrocera tryoni TaxID=59916 RepID=UPI001A97B78E|nr:serine protease inhibitor 42Dd-like isoform X3 [Bactrocera tryoni]
MLMSFIGRKIVNAKNLLALWSPLNRRGNNCNFDTFLSFVLLLSVYTTTATMSSHDQLVAQREFASKSAQFAVKLFNHMYKSDPNKNIIYSPFSIQTCVGMARIGAVGETAAELDRGLGLPPNDVTAIADTFHNVLVTYKDSPILKIANKIYVMQGYSVKKEFNEIATTKFYSSADSINFADNANAANTINKWVESKTNNLIKNLISPDALDSDTRVVLVNAIHFKGEWKYQFPKSATRDDDFYLNEVDSVRVPMMNLKESFGYGVISELDATVLEMPYKDSDLSMVVILPNSRTGLASLQEKLKNFNLSDITRYLIHTKVIVKMPKFKAEYDIELNDALINLGMARMFSKDAEFSNMLDSDEPLQVSKVVHKAFIEVNEEGTEAAAATAVIVSRITSVGGGPPPPRLFIADKPFAYIIKNKANLILFAGQKTKA